MLWPGEAPWLLNKDFGLSRAPTSSTLIRKEEKAVTEEGETPDSTRPWQSLGEYSVP